MLREEEERQLREAIQASLKVTPVPGSAKKNSAAPPLYPTNNTQNQTPSVVWSNCICILYCVKLYSSDSGSLHVHV